MLRAYVIVAAAVLLLTTSAVSIALAHENHGAFSAGEPGDPKKSARVIKVKMFEDGKKMQFEPARIEVRKGAPLRVRVQG